MRPVNARAAVAALTGPVPGPIAEPLAAPAIEATPGHDRALIGGVRRSPREWLTRRHLGFAVGTVVVLWLLVTFARAVAQSTAATDRVAQLRAENRVLAAQLEAGRRELVLIRGRAFSRLEARAYGMGKPGERIFALAAGAPPPAPITPLGAEPAAQTVASPIEDWLIVLLGR
ncbi:MAG TPA: hypothetical protein VGQ47_00430 [Candidatus Limnocylindrales bacterium]|jgi:cell division protein FtsB|nr:hypothetical protein [Candidatus Limnocylindrales bacterium]